MDIFQILAIIILVVFYLIYFGKSLLLKKHNIKTNRIAKGKKSKSAMQVEVLLKIFSFAIIAAEIASVFYSDIFYIISDEPALKIAGIAAGFLGTVIFLISVINMKTSWRAGIDETQKTNLITGGIYKISRNPAFIGFYLVYIGICLAFFNIMLLIVTVITIIIFHLQILQEEKFLEKVFGKEYLKYKSKTNRYLGLKFLKKRLF